MVKSDDLEATQALLNTGMRIRLLQHGQAAHQSNHESLGVITEEFFELVEAVRSNERKQVKLELMDVAVACMFALASMFSREDDDGNIVGTSGNEVGTEGDVKKPCGGCWDFTGMSEKEVRKALSDAVTIGTCAVSDAEIILRHWKELSKKEEERKKSTDDH